jgi:hypothetical protein
LLTIFESGSASIEATSYEDVLASFSNDLDWRSGKLTSESSSGVAEEVASTKLTASADQSAVVDGYKPLI